MLSEEDNAILCQVGPGTPMGELMRLYWVPVAATSELGFDATSPMRIRLLGENLVAYRLTIRISR